MGATGEAMLLAAVDLAGGGANEDGAAASGCRFAAAFAAADAGVVGAGAVGGGRFPEEEATAGCCDGDDPDDGICIDVLLVGGGAEGGSAADGGGGEGCLLVGGAGEGAVLPPCPIKVLAPAGRAVAGFCCRAVLVVSRMSFWLVASVPMKSAMGALEPLKASKSMPVVFFRCVRPTSMPTSSTTAISGLRSMASRLPDASNSFSNMRPK